MARPVMVDLSIDLTGLAQFSGFLEELSVSMSSTRTKKTMAEAAHSLLAEDFDDYMSLWATANRENYAHVYEYAINGEPYRHVGDNKYKLWGHSRRYISDGALMATFKFLPAKHRIPTYRQRRNSTVGSDPMREIHEADFTKLMEKTKNRRWTFIWKAPMLEYSIPRQITPSAAKWLFLPAFGFTSPMAKSHPGWRFTKSYVATQEPPGNSAGMFTSAWTAYWGSLSEEKWDRIGGDAMVKALDAPVDNGVNKLTKKARNKTVKFMQPSDFSMAYKEGKKHARDAMDMYTSRLNVMNMSSEWKVWSDGSV